MANRIDNVELTLWLANKANNHNVLADHKRPLLNAMIKNTSEKDITIKIKAGQTAYLPSPFANHWGNVALDFGKNKVKVSIPNDINKPAFKSAKVKAASA